MDTHGDVSGCALTKMLRIKCEVICNLTTDQLVMELRKNNKTMERGERGISEENARLPRNEAAFD